MMSVKVVKKPEQKVWFITGASSGFGQEMVKALLQEGELVVATSRDKSKFAEITDPNFLGVEVKDLNSEVEVKVAVEQALTRFKRIDVLVNNAGYGLSGMFEELDQNAIQEQFNVNVFGLMNVTKMVLPTLRAQRSGLILNFGSAVSIIGFPGYSIYSTTKFAISGWTESIGLELAQFNIKTCLIAPGPYKTDFLATNIVKTKSTIADYQKQSEEFYANQTAENGTQPGDVATGVQVILKTAAMENPPTRLFLGDICLQIAEIKNKEWKQIMARDAEMNNIAK